MPSSSVSHFPLTIPERGVSQLVPVVVIEEFHPKRIVVEKFLAIEENADMVDPYIHRVQAVPGENLMEPFHRCEVASLFHILSCLESV